MTRSGATSQTYPTPGHKANPQFSLRTTHPGTSPTQKPAHHKGEPFPGRSTRGLAAIFPHQRRRLRKQYTPPTPTANPPSAGSANPNSASLLGSTAITCQCGTPSVEKHFYGVAHIARRSVSVQAPAARAEQRHVAWGPVDSPTNGAPKTRAGDYRPLPRPRAVGAPRSLGDWNLVRKAKGTAVGAQSYENVRWTLVNARPRTWRS